MADPVIIQDKIYSNMTITPEILQNTRFVNCTFLNCFFGKVRGEVGKINFARLNARFRNCRFENANFKGVSPENFAAAFSGPRGLASATHLPESFRKTLKDSPEPVSRELREEYLRTGVTNKGVTAPPRQPSLLDLFGRQKRGRDPASEGEASPSSAKRPRR